MINGEKTTAIDWCEMPNEVDQKERTHLYRVPEKGLKSAVIISKKVIGCYTHYWGGRTQPCLKHDCPACEKEVSRRWYGWLTIWNPSSGEIVIMEITKRACKEVTKFFELHKTMRGATVSGARKGGKANGELKLTIKPAKNDRVDLPTDINRMETLELIWETKRRNIIGRSEPESQTIERRLEAEKTALQDEFAGDPTWDKPTLKEEGETHAFPNFNRVQKERKKAS